MHNFLCLKGRTEFLWGTVMEAHRKSERPWVSEWLILKSYLFKHISETLQNLSPHF